MEGGIGGPAVRERVVTVGFVVARALPAREFIASVNDDFVIEDVSGIRRQGVRGVGQLRPRVGDGVVRFGEVGFTLHRRVEDGVKIGGDASVSDEFSLEGDQFKRVSSVVHAAELGPNVVDRVITHQAVG